MGEGLLCGRMGYPGPSGSIGLGVDPGSWDAVVGSRGGRAALGSQPLHPTTANRSQPHPICKNDARGWFSSWASRFCPMFPCQKLS